MVGSVRIGDLRIFTEPQQGATYDDILAMARRAELLGFGAFFRSDHYLAMGTDGLPGPTDAWITLAGLARETETIRLGTLVSPVTFRMPGPLAIAVAQVDQMSRGRVELGLGAGWFAAEHAAYGIPFPGAPDRFADLAEQLAIIQGMWRAPVGERFDYPGTRWQVSSSPALPKPVQEGGPPIVMGGTGPRRTPELAALHAAEFNLAFDTLERFAERQATVGAACAAIGRDPSSMVYSAALVLCCGRDEAEFARRAAAIGREVGELRAVGAAGTPPEVARTLRAWQAAGAQRIYLQVLDLADLEHLDLVASEVVPLV